MTALKRRHAYSLNFVYVALIFVYISNLEAIVKYGNTSTNANEA